MHHPVSDPQTCRDLQYTGCKFTVGGHVHTASHAAVVRVPHPPLLCALNNPQNHEQEHFCLPPQLALSSPSSSPWCGNDGAAGHPTPTGTTWSIEKDKWANCPIVSTCKVSPPLLAYGFSILGRYEGPRLLVANWLSTWTLAWLLLMGPQVRTGWEVEGEKPSVDSGSSQILHSNSDSKTANGLLGSYWSPVTLSRLA